MAFDTYKRGISRTLVGADGDEPVSTPSQVDQQSEQAIKEDIDESNYRIALKMAQDDYKNGHQERYWGYARFRDGSDETKWASDIEDMKSWFDVQTLGPDGYVPSNTVYATWWDRANTGDPEGSEAPHYEQSAQVIDLTWYNQPRAPSLLPDDYILPEEESHGGNSGLLMGALGAVAGIGLVVIGGKKKRKTRV